MDEEIARVRAALRDWRFTLDFSDPETRYVFDGLMLRLDLLVNKQRERTRATLTPTRRFIVHRRKS